jgi:hypothetical protein
MNETMIWTALAVYWVYAGFAVFIEARSEPINSWRDATVGDAVVAIVFGGLLVPLRLLRKAVR